MTKQTLAQQGILSPCLLVVEDGSSVGEDEWLNAIGDSTEVCLYTSE